MTHSVIYSGNDSRIILRGLKDRAGAFITAASVTLISFLDRNGSAVSGITVPGTLNHVTDGDYELLLPNAIDVRPERRYSAIVRAEYSGLRGEWHETVLCTNRES